MYKLKVCIIMLLPIFLFFLSCSEEESLPKPTTFTASNGNYLGVIHLAYEAVPGAEIYEVYRLNNQTAEWQDISWTEFTSWDDEGYLLDGGVLVPGEEYQYKFRTHANGPGFGPYSEITTGYSFKPEEAEIISITRDYEESENLIVWNDPNDYTNIQNIVYVSYDIYAANEENLDYFYEIGSTSDLSYEHYIYGYDVDKVFYYKIVTNYTYSISDQHRSMYNSMYALTGDMVKEGSGGGGPDIVSYDRLDLGTVYTSGEAITFTEIKQNGSNIYLGILKDVGITGYGQPAVYQFSGSSWSETGGTLPEDITNSTSIGRMGIAAGSSKIYMAALDLDSIYIYESNASSWSGNLAFNNLGFAEAPSAMDIEVFNDELYLAAKVYPDWDLKIFKWAGSQWETIGGDANGFITNGESVFEVTLNNLGETLYVSYLIQNSGDNSTLNIKHLNGSSWDTSLEWDADYISGIKIDKGANDLYFISSTASFGSYKGGVYKVASTSTVEELITENDDWFYTPYAITVDSDGNVIISSTKYESETLIYPNLSLYDGSAWSTISGDFTDGSEPVSVHADGTSIYYVYGDADNVTTEGDTKAIKSIKFTK